MALVSSGLSSLLQAAVGTITSRGNTRDARGRCGHGLGVMGRATASEVREEVSTSLCVWLVSSNAVVSTVCLLESMSRGPSRPG